MGISLKFDEKKNRIFAEAGVVTLEEANQYAAELPEILKKVKPGFTGITNLLGSKTLSPDVVAVLGETGAVAQGHGLKNWVFVVESAVYQLQMKRLFGEFSTYFKTMKEAEDFLDQN